MKRKRVDNLTPNAFRAGAEGSNKLRRHGENCFVLHVKFTRCFTKLRYITTCKVNFTRKISFREVFLEKIEYPVYKAKRYRYPPPKMAFGGGIELKHISEENLN